MAEDKVTDHKMIMVGGSAGSLDVLLKMAASLDVNLPVALVIVLHRKSSFDSSLSELLQDRINWPAKEAEEKEPVLARHIYIAPGDYHLLIEKDFTFSLDDSEKINYSRPSIDASFESAADVYGRSLTAVLLSGANADGAKGLLKVKEAGGVCIVQDPATAEVAYMPEQAILRNAAEHIVPGNDMAQFLNRLLAQNPGAVGNR